MIGRFSCAGRILSIRTVNFGATALHGNGAAHANEMMGSDKCTQAGMLWDFGCGSALSSQEVLVERWWRAALCGCMGMVVCAGNDLGYRNHRIRSGFLGVLGWRWVEGWGLLLLSIK